MQDIDAEEMGWRDWLGALRTAESGSADSGGDGSLHYMMEADV